MKAKKIEFSKIIVIISFSIEALVTVFTCVMVWRTMDMSGLMYVAATGGSTILTAVSFYFWKARVENRSKTAKSFVRAIADIYGIEPAIKILEIITKE